MPRIGTAEHGRDRLAVNEAVLFHIGDQRSGISGIRSGGNGGGRGADHQCGGTGLVESRAGCRVSARHDVLAELVQFLRHGSAGPRPEERGGTLIMLRSILFTGGHVLAVGIGVSGIDHFSDSQRT